MGWSWILRCIWTLRSIRSVSSIWIRIWVWSWMGRSRARNVRTDRSWDGSNCVGGKQWFRRRRPTCGIQIVCSSSRTDRPTIQSPIIRRDHSRQIPPDSFRCGRTNQTQVSILKWSTRDRIQILTPAIQVVDPSGCHLLVCVASIVTTRHLRSLHSKPKRVSYNGRLLAYPKTISRIIVGSLDWSYGDDGSCVDSSPWRLARSHARVLSVGSSQFSTRSTQVAILRIAIAQVSFIITKKKMIL
jgi:hypothetical protein